MEMEKKSGKLELLELKTVKVLDKDQQLQLKGGDDTEAGKDGDGKAVDWTAVDTR
ncbi:MAG: hypothetical protein HUU01_10280 [Saprospiraceae bacterium]|nr:hypothetical protein [Saprospiraceae bacterium]